MMRRGCVIFPLHLRKSEKELTQFQKNCRKLNKFAWGSRIKPISIKQDKSMKNNIKSLAKELGCKAYVFGNTKVHVRDADMPIFEPLVGLNKKQLKTFDKIVL